MHRYTILLILLSSAAMAAERPKWCNDKVIDPKGLLSFHPQDGMGNPAEQMSGAFAAFQRQFSADVRVIVNHYPAGAFKPGQFRPEDCFDANNLPANMILVYTHDFNKKAVVFGSKFSGLKPKEEKLRQARRILMQLDTLIGYEKESEDNEDDESMKYPETSMPDAAYPKANEKRLRSSCTSVYLDLLLAVLKVRNEPGKVDAVISVADLGPVFSKWSEMWLTVAQ